MNGMQHAILAYAISFCLLAGYAVSLWVQWRKLNRR